MTKIAIIGAGGFAREVLDVIEACAAAGSDIEAAGFIVDSQFGVPGQLVNDKPILGDFQWLSEHVGEYSVICAVGAPEKKLALVERARWIGCRFATIIHPTVLMTRWVEIGEGTIITAGCILTNRIRVGTHVQINLGSTVGHDAELKDFVTLAPGVHISGNVVLNHGAYIGTGTNIIERVTIGEWAIIGAGSTVIRDIPANATAVGAPAVAIKERRPGWHLES